MAVPEPYLVGSRRLLDILGHAHQPTLRKGTHEDSNAHYAF